MRMQRKYKLYQIDSFTQQKFTGNPAGVITNASGLTTDQMQKIAKELNNSETAFIFPANNSNYDVHVRFFTPTNEVPICGHATIAAHYARANEKHLRSSTVYHKTGAGVLPVDIIKEKEDYKIVMTQGEIEFGDIIEGIIKNDLLTALNLHSDDLLEGCDIQIVSTGHSKVMIGVKNMITLNRIKPDYTALSKLSKAIHCNGYYVFTTSTDGSDTLIHGRMFAPAIGIKEDPVTGNANGPLGAYLVHHNLVQHNNSLFTFKAKQGEAMGRPGIIEVQVYIEDNNPIKVKIAGNAVEVFKTELLL